jgi:transcription initiation factor TFIID TATA-box-binding protein
MFTTTNVAAAAASAGGPVATVVSPTFQIISTPVTGPSSSSTTSSTWRLTPTSSSGLIKQPSVVSIINRNMNVTSSTSLPINSTGVTMPTNGTVYYITTTTNSQQHNPITIGNISVQSPQTVRLVSTPIQSSSSTPTLTRLNNSNTNVRQILTPSNSSTNNNSKPGICIDTPILGLLAPITIQRQIITNSPVQQIQSFTLPAQNQITEQTNSTNSCIVSNDDNSLINNSQDQEIEIFINNVVCSFALCCKLDLRKIAKEAANVIYKREQSMVLMKMRNPNCTANIWSSGKVTVTGTTSEDDARRGARRIARSVQRLGFRIKFRHFRVVNCLATCSMPWPIDIVKLSRTYSECVSYEPEMHPGATVRLPDKAVLKVFTTGSVTLTAPCVERINTAVNDFYPQLFECRKINRDERKC